MANYASLKSAIQQVVKTNGNNEITGALLQQSLLAMINSLGAGYQFAGVAIPGTTNPGTPDQNVFYIGGAGTYSNFTSSPVTVAPGNIVVFKYNGSWTSNVVQTQSDVDANIFNVSEYNAVDGVFATYESLSAARSAVPTQKRKGGMLIKYIDANTQQYVFYQYLNTGTTGWITNANWVGWDAEPVYGSGNLVKSGGAYLWPVKMDKFVRPYEAYDFRGFVDEIYIDPQYLKFNGEAVEHLGIRYYSGSIYVVNRYTTGPTTYYFRCLLSVSTMENGVVYELKSSGTVITGGVPSGTVVGYIVCKNLESLDSSYSYAAVLDNLIIDSTTNLSFSPRIATKIGLDNFSITPDKISLGGLYLSSHSGYENDIAELFVIESKLTGVGSIDARFYNGYIYFRAFTTLSGNTYVWTCANSIGDWINGKVYPLICTTAGGDASVGDICGYIVFKDIAHFRATADSQAHRNPIDVDRAKILYIQPYIEGYLTAASGDIPDGTITIDKLTDSAKANMVGNGLTIELPDELCVVANNTVRVHWRSILKCPNPYIYDVYAVAAIGKNYPRYYEVTPTAVGTTTVTVYVKNSAGLILAQKAFTLRCVAAMSSPASNINILTVGASATANGHLAGELKRRLTASDGAGTTQSPTGLGLSNITFVGRKTGSEDTTVQQEATGGWSWKDYATAGRAAFRFNVSGVNELSLASVYRDSNSNYQFTILEINVTDGTGEIRCSYTGSGTIPASGSLTKVSGNGDSTITYGSYTTEGVNPFWNIGQSKLDFISYANSYCNGSIGVLLSHCGMNDVARYTPANMSALFTDYIKPFARALHTDFPNAKFVFSTLPLGSIDGGLGASYGASSFWNFGTLSKNLFKLAELAHEMAADAEFSGYFSVADVIPFFDCENLYPRSNKPLALRLSTDESLQSNGVHPIVAGNFTVSDAIYNFINKILG